MKRARIDAFLTIAGEELDAAQRLEKVLPRQAAYFLSQAVAGASTSTRYPSPTGRLFDVDAKRLGDDMNSVRMLIGRVTAYLAAFR